MSLQLMVIFVPLTSPEPIPAGERQDRTVFLLDSCSPEHSLGIRLESIQEVISQVLKKKKRRVLWFILFSCENTLFLCTTKRQASTMLCNVTHSFSLSVYQDRHCLLELGMASVEGLLRQGIYPIVIHIRPKNKKHKKLRWVLTSFAFDYMLLL